MRDIEIVEKIKKAIKNNEMVLLLTGRDGYCVPTDYPDLPTDLAMVIPHLYRFMQTDIKVAKSYTKAIMAMIASDEIWQIYMAGQILLLQLYYEAIGDSPILIKDPLLQAFRIRYPEVYPYLKGRINKGNKILIEKYQKNLL